MTLGRTIFNEYYSALPQWVKTFEKLYYSPDLDKVRNFANNDMLIGLVEVPNLDYDYNSYSYIQIDDCMQHTTTFPANSAVFVDVFCGNLTIVGSNVGEVNVI